MVGISFPAGKKPHCGNVLTPISALGSWLLTFPKARFQESWLFLLAHAVSKLSHHRDLQQNTGNFMRCYILFQTFCLTISSQAQGRAAVGTEEVGKIWPQSIGTGIPQHLGVIGQEICLECTDPLIACECPERDIC